MGPRSRAGTVMKIDTKGIYLRKNWGIMLRFNGLWRNLSRGCLPQMGSWCGILYWDTDRTWYHCTTGSGSSPCTVASSVSRHPQGHIPIPQRPSSVQTPWGSFRTAGDLLHDMHDLISWKYHAVMPETIRSRSSVCNYFKCMMDTLRSTQYS